MFCHNCGKQIPDDSKFCRFCGARQFADGDAPAQPNYAAQSASQPNYTTQQANQPNYAAQPASQPSYAAQQASQPNYAAQPVQPQRRRQNVFGGIIGALLGSLLGVVVMVLLDQLGYVAAISGVVMAFCTLKGYELLGRRLSGTGIVIGVIVIVGMIYMGNMLSWGIAMYRSGVFGGADILMCMRALPNFVAQNSEVEDSYYTGLMMQYAFAALGAVPIIWRAIKANRSEKRAR